MALSRKRKRELDRLKGRAADLWDDQRDVLERANRVVRDAGRQGRSYVRDEVAPRARGAYDRRVRPAVASGFSASREKLVDDVFPAVSSALGSALAVLEAAKDPRVRDVLKKVGARGTAVASKTGLVKAQSSRGPGRYILIGVGIVAVAGVAYAAWQTLRSDDDLWIDDEELTEPASDIQAS